MEIRKTLFKFVVVDGTKIEIVLFNINSAYQTGRVILFLNNSWSLVMTSFSVSQVFMGGGKSLYINRLRNLLVSISAFTVIAVMFFANTENVYSQCPPGYSGEFTTVFNLCDGGCPVEVVWCCKASITSSAPSVHLVSFRFLANPLACSCVDMQPHHEYDHDIPYIPFDRIMTGLVNSGQGCFPGGPPPGITECGEYTLQYLFSTGACYRYDNSYENWGYYKCDTTPGDAQCFESYEICYEFVNGVYVMHTRPSGAPVTPNFQCVGGCHTLCEIMTY